MTSAFTEEAANKALDASEGNLIIRPQKSKSTTVEYYEVGLMHNGVVKPLNVIVRDIVVFRGPMDPTNTSDYRYGMVKRESNTDADFYDVHSVECAKSTAGTFGDFLVRVNNIINQRFAEGAIPGCEDKKLIPLVSTHYSRKPTVKEELRGKPREDPIFRFKLKFKPQSERHPIPAQRGKPQTNLRDDTKPVVQNGKISREPLMWNGEQVNHMTCHNVLNQGAVIKSGRIHMSTITVSNMGVSLQLVMGEASIVPSEGAGYDESELYGTLEETAPAAEDDGEMVYE